jgi:hypothetical protein
MATNLFISCKKVENKEDEVSRIIVDKLMKNKRIFKNKRIVVMDIIILKIREKTIIRDFLLSG